MPYSRRTGLGYAQGSSNAWSPDAWEDRTCCVCGGRIIVKHNAFFSRFPDPLSAHAECGGMRAIHQQRVVGGKAQA